MLSITKHQERLKNLSAIAKKVYEAVPLSEPWSMTCIHQEIQRSGSTTRDTRLVHGCLDTLKESGLVLEPSRGTFVRAPIRQDKPKAEPFLTPPKEATPMTTPAPKQPRAPMAILSDLAAKCKALTDEIETAAIEIDEYVTAKDADAAKLKQLQALLKGLA